LLRLAIESDLIGDGGEVAILRAGVNRRSGILPLGYFTNAAGRRIYISVRDGEGWKMPRWHLSTGSQVRPRGTSLFHCRVGVRRMPACDAWQVSSVAQESPG